MVHPWAALATGWGITEVGVSGAHLGVSRLTWRVPGSGWLSAVPPDEGQDLRREHALMAQLRLALPPSVAVPQVVPALSGEDIVAHDGFLWRLTSHLPGRPPDINDPTEYRVTSQGLAVLHRILAGLDDRLAVRGQGLLSLVETARERTGEWAAEPLSPGTDEAQSLSGLVGWLEDSVSALQPTQLIHGDWATPNLLVSEAGGVMSLTGILDWQDTAVGSPVLDLAQPASSALMWSSRQDPTPALEGILDGYRDGGGGDYGVEDLKVGVAAYWLGQYGRLRDRVARTGPDLHLARILQRNPLRLRAAWAFAAS